MFEDQWKALIRQIVQKYLGNDVRVFIFGSRATGKNRKWSDIDVGIVTKEKLGNQILFIQDDLEQSDIPYRVDVVDFKTVSPQFAKVALSSTIEL